MKSWLRLDGFITLLFGALVILFYWRLLTPNPADRQSFPPGDFYLQFWAFTTFDRQQLSTRQLPLWNPYAFAGSPFWADVQAAVFYPFSLLTLLLSAPWGFSAFALALEALAHFWLAAFFMYLLVKKLTQSRSAAIIAALTFTFSGYLTGYPSQQLAVLEADIWLPLILFFLYKEFHNGPVSRLGHPSTPPPLLSPNLLFAGLAWGMTLLAGHPQSAFMIACISCAYLAFLFFETEAVAGPGRVTTGKRLTHFIIHLLLFIAVGLGVAAIQFIPAIEYTLLSVRAAGTYDKMSGGFPLVDLIQFLLPGQISHYSPLYVGVIGLILALWTIVATPARNRHTVFWGLLAAVALLISFGGNTFLYSPLYLALPGFSIFRGQERWAFAVAFSLSVLAGYGFKALGQQRLDDKWSGIARITQYLFFFALSLVFLFFIGLNQTGWTPQSPFLGLLGVASLLTVLLALAWLLWRFAPQLHPALLTSLTASLICFDLFTVNWQINLYPQPFEWHTQTPAIVTAIKADAANTPNQPYRVYNEFRLHDNYGTAYQIEDLWGASPLRPARYNEFLAPPMPIERTWELLNVKYVITWRKELYVPSTIIYQEPAEKDTTYVHRLNNVGPRAWLVTQAEIAADPTILQKIADPNFDRWQIALLESNQLATQNEVVTQILNNSSVQDTASPQPVEPTSYAASRLTYQVSAAVPSLLILSEVDYLGWQATIDGQPAPIFRADYVLRAVPLPPGEHTVELAFQPLSLTIGAIISAITLSSLIWGIIFLQRR